ncbi:hypothetical protein OQA88_8276 [Cercophora sp. LCS_1]
MADDMPDGLPDSPPQNPDLETYLAGLREAAENEYGPAFRALQNVSTFVHIPRSVAGTPSPGGDPITRVRSPEPQDFTANWPEPDSYLIGSITEELEIPQRLQDQTAYLHLDDLRTTWFGVPHDQKDSPPKLFVWPRLQNLLSNASDQPDYQYPSLVSFVGDTGSGKSTIIKAMIRMLAPQTHYHARYQVPVPGTGHDQFTSTSSDVHLYADPWTISTEVPMLFADCEGLIGTSTPVARRVTSAGYRNQRSNVTARAAREMDALVKDHLKKVSMEVSLSWARIEQPQTRASRIEVPSDAGRDFDSRYSDDFSEISEARSDSSLVEPLGHVQADSRNLITKSLYPRVLYAFSDVICFVTSNTRASQGILWKLFEWSKDGLERTFNQRVRPGLIIIVNKNTPDDDNLLPNVDNTTDMFLESVERSVKFGEYKQKWRSRQRRVNTAADLIQCYYDDFRVVSLPLHSDMPSTASRVALQIKRLYHEIRTLSDNIHSRRKAHDLTMDTATFNAYFERSVEILARDHTSSLDFHPLSEDDSPLPTRFSEHMAIVLGKRAKLGNSRLFSTNGGELQMVKKMTPFLACSILCSPIKDANRKSKITQTSKSNSLTKLVVAWSDSATSFGGAKPRPANPAARTIGRAMAKVTSLNAHKKETSTTAGLFLEEWLTAKDLRL